MKKVLFLVLCLGVIRSCQPTHAEEVDVRTRIAVAMAMSKPKVNGVERVSKYLPAVLPAVSREEKGCDCLVGGPCRCGSSCECVGCPYHTSYRKARARAIDKGLPLVVFVGYKKIPHIPEVVSVSVASLEDAASPSVVVGLPDGRGDLNRVADLTDYPSVDTIIAKLTPKKTTPAAPQSSTTNCQFQQLQPFIPMGGFGGFGGGCSGGGCSGGR